MLGDPAAELILPIISLAEAIYVVEKGRTSLPSSDHLLLEVLSDPRIAVCPLTLDILQLSRSIPAAVPEMHDRLIVATAYWLAQAGHAVALVTKDQALVEAAAVPIVWD